MLGNDVESLGSNAPRRAQHHHPLHPHQFSWQPWLHNGFMVQSAAVDTRFRLAESMAWSLAEAYDTPLYVVSEPHFRQTIRRYMAAFKAAWPNCELSYASKANSTLALLTIA